MFHRSGTAHQARQGGCATLHDPQGVVQRSAATSLAIGVIVPAQNHFSKETAHLVWTSREALFARTRLLPRDPPVGVVEQVFQCAPAIPQESFANAQLQPLRRQGPLDRQSRLG